MEGRRYVVSRYVIGNKQAKAAGIWEHMAKIAGKKGTRTPLGDPRNRGL